MQSEKWTDELTKTDISENKRPADRCCSPLLNFSTSSPSSSSFYFPGKREKERWLRGAERRRKQRMEIIFDLRLVSSSSSSRFGILKALCVECLCMYLNIEQYSRQSTTGMKWPERNRRGNKNAVGRSFVRSFGEPLKRTNGGSFNYNNSQQQQQQQQQPTVEFNNGEAPVSVYTCVYVCIRVYTCVYMCVYMCVYVCAPEPKLAPGRPKPRALARSFPHRRRRPVQVRWTSSSSSSSSSSNNISTMFAFLCRQPQKPGRLDWLALERASALARSRSRLWPPPPPSPEMMIACACCCFFSRRRRRRFGPRLLFSSGSLSRRPLLSFFLVSVELRCEARRMPTWNQKQDRSTGRGAAKRRSSAAEIRPTVKKLKGEHVAAIGTSVMPRIYKYNHALYLIQTESNSLLCFGFVDRFTASSWTCFARVFLSRPGSSSSSQVEESSSRTWLRAKRDCCCPSILRVVRFFHSVRSMTRQGDLQEIWKGAFLSLSL